MVPGHSTLEPTAHLLVPFGTGGDGGPGGGGGPRRLLNTATGRKAVASPPPIIGYNDLDPDSDDGRCIYSRTITLAVQLYSNTAYNDWKFHSSLRVLDSDIGTTPPQIYCLLLSLGLASCVVSANNV